MTVADPVFHKAVAGSPVAMHLRGADMATEVLNIIGERITGHRRPRLYLQ